MCELEGLGPQCHQSGAGTGPVWGLEEELPPPVASPVQGDSAIAPGWLCSWGVQRGDAGIRAERRMSKALLSCSRCRQALLSAL